MRTTKTRIFANRFELNFAFFVNKTIVDFFTISHVESTVSIEKNELEFKNFWSKIFWCSDSNVWKDENWSSDFITISFFDVSHVNSIAEIEKNELNIVLKIDVKNVFVKTISKSCKKMKFDWFLNQMSTKS